MARVTTKLQVTVPKRVADAYHIRPGDEIEFVPAGETIRVLPPRRSPSGPSTVAERLALFDQATRRLRSRPGPGRARRGSTDRGWSREDLYARARAR